MPEDRSLIAAFEEGERAAAADAPRFICNYVAGDERFDAWHAGYDWESRDDGPYVICSANMPAIHRKR